MSIANCARCNRMFHKQQGVKICPDCAQAEEDAFLRVRDAMEANPEADMEALCAEADVDAATVTRLVKAGRLATMEEAVRRLGIACRQCSEPVIRGHYCPACTETMGQAFKDSAQALKTQPRSARDPRRI